MNPKTDEGYRFLLYKQHLLFKKLQIKSLILLMQCLLQSDANFIWRFIYKIVIVIALED